MVSRLFKAFLKSFSNLKIRQKLLLSYFVLIIIPLGVITLVTYYRVSDIIERQTRHSAMQSFEQARLSLTTKLNEAVNTSNIIALDKDTNEILARSIVNRNETEEPDYEIIAREVEDRDYLLSFFENLKKNRDIEHIRLYLWGETTYSSENVNFFHIREIGDTLWYRRLVGYRGNILWCPASDFQSTDRGGPRVISAVRLLKNRFNLTQNIAVLRVDLKEMEIQDIIKEAAAITKTGVVYIENSEGVILSSTSMDEARNWVVDQDFYKSSVGNEWETVVIQGKEAIMHYRSIEGTDWRLVFIIPLSEVLSSSMRLRNEMLILMVLIGAAAYYIAYRISSSSTEGIARLARRMRKVQAGDLNVIIEKYGRDEVGQLTEDFNYMVEKMKILIEEQFRIGQEAKNAELKALQAQINPHFLYNTLDLINWMAMRHKAQDIVFMVHALSRFYKLSLSKGKDIVTIGNEIEHVKIYVDIQNKRFEDGIQLLLEVDPQILEYKTLKIILQPIVENAILHGIIQKKSRTGTIRICGELLGDTVLLKVEDDGIGMTKEDADKILSSESTDAIHGYGVKNIHDRIKLYFGSQYGLSYWSAPGVGTCVEIRIPALPSV